MKFDIKKQLQLRTERVKGIDFHPTEPWAIVRTIEVSDVPVRAGRFIARKNWIVVGSDDYQIRVFNYNTSEKVAQFEAHPDYIRALAVHPTQPLVISGADDASIKMWNWEQGWRQVRSFEGHNHYVMYLAFNPKDPNTFASACLDGSVKIWSLGSSTPNLTFLAHETSGVNFVEYYPHADKPYLITSSDDKTIRVWDYQMKGNVATIEGHTSNVSFAVFHPELPIIISGSEDNSVKIWNSNTFKLEETLNYGLDRSWCVSCRKGSNLVALGFDSGSVVLQLGQDNPAISMDPNGKLIWAKHSEVYSSIVKHTDDLKDGDILPLTQKDLGSVEVYPTQLVHSPNGRFVAVTGDGEYIIYTALAWRNKAFGSGLDFAWAQDSNEFAVRDSSSNVKVFKNFKERPSGHLNVPFRANKIFGGTLLGIKGDDFIAFYDWDTGKLVRRVDVVAEQVCWSESGELLAIITSDTFYVLKFDREIFLNALQTGAHNDEDGAEDSFDVIYDISDSVRTGKWVGDCFIYTTFSNKLHYLVGGETYTINHFEKQMYLLGYIPRDDSIYLADKDVNVTSYHLSLKVIEYQTVVLRGDLDLAAELLEDIPASDRTKVSRFLQAQGYTELALQISEDADQKFELALSLGDLDTAKTIAEELKDDFKWKALGDSALQAWNITLAEESFKNAKDLESLFLIYSSTGDKNGLSEVADKAASAGKFNLAFNAAWLLKDVSKSVELLNKTGRHSEAALLGLTYGADVTESVDNWKNSLKAQGKTKTADSISSPQEEPEKFPHLLKNGNGAADLIDVEEQEELVEVEPVEVDLIETEETAVEPVEPAAPVAAQSDSDSPSDLIDA
ncbi:hypothetical protein DV451_000212 [Geotrichum candidum]|uniref:Coatomer subunit beta' n=1 Tax=Geotrichum candidum TaxID=1173061 RepID=A0A9P5GAU3_GEOCN|nr:hypothetical protein DV451_000212 [Geotrichum candidum]KAF5105337.1 hypothetical protein DV453_004938 [Geotrichum candidum]